MFWHHFDPIFKSWIFYIEFDNFLKRSFVVCGKEEVCADVVNIVIRCNPLIDNWLDFQFLVQIFVFFFLQIGVEEKNLFVRSLAYLNEQVISIVCWASRNKAF